MSLMIARTSSCMLAREVPLLKDKQLCDFLSQMDLEEGAIMTQEQQDARGRMDTFNQHKSTQEKIGLAMAGAGLCGFILSIAAMASLTNYEAHFSRRGLITRVSLMASFVILMLGLALKGSVRSKAW